jgi:hypothetical protein
MIAFDEDPIQRLHRAVSAKRGVTPKDMYELWRKKQDTSEDSGEISGVRVKENADNISNYTG